MISLLLILPLLTVPPPLIGCSLTVDQDHQLGPSPIQVREFTGNALAQRGYRLTYNRQSVRTWLNHRPRLSSITWRRPNGQTATLTCTQTRGTRTAPPEPTPRTLLCLDGTTHLRTGVQRLQFKSQQLTWTASATGNDFRLQAESEGVGMIASWADAPITLGHTLSLEVSDHLVSCWRY
jgi:hypothetical protein